MFNKITTFSISKDDIEILDGELIKVASSGFLPTDHAYDPDFLYLRVRGVSAGEYWGPNNNADFFPEQELKDNYKTFLTAHAFKNHENKEVEKAIGDIIDASWNDVMKYAQLIIRIDRKIAPQIVRGFEKGFMTDVSMGCKIKHSICSICGNVAKTKKEYCHHILNEKHKIYSDGRRVYEINIGPNFHDISAVLKGADRTAKVTGLLIMGSKVAFNIAEQQIEKVASTLQDSILNERHNFVVPYYKSPEFHGNHKIAFDLEEAEIFDRRGLSRAANEKEDFIQKIAEIKKTIQGKVIALANARINEENKDNIDDLIKLLKLFYTDYWGEDKCKQIADSIKRIADARVIPVYKAMDHFIRVAELAGIELTSLEFDRIIRHLDQSPEARKLEEILEELKEFIPISRKIEFCNEADAAVEEFGSDVNLQDILKMRKKINSTPPTFVDKLAPARLGDIVRNLVVRSHPDTDDCDCVDQFMDVIKAEIPNRSFHRAHLMPRIIKIVKTNKKPDISNLSHFLAPLFLKSKQILDIPLGASAYGYAAYQKSRPNFVISHKYQQGLSRFANEIFNENSLEASLMKYASFEKKSSIYQNSHSINRMPTGVSLLCGYSTSQRQKIQTGNNDLTNKEEHILKEALSGDYLSTMSKESPAITNKEFNIDMFNNHSIENKLAERYNKNQRTILKYATVLYGLGMEDSSEEVLASVSLNFDDINQYLKVAVDSVTIELEKQANVLVDAATFALFAPPGTSALAALPGNLLDAVVLSRLSRKAKKDADNVAGSQNQLETPITPKPVDQMSNPQIPKVQVPKIEKFHKN